MLINEWDLHCNTAWVYVMGDDRLLQLVLVMFSFQLLALHLHLCNWHCVVAVVWWYFMYCLYVVMVVYSIYMWYI